MLGEFININHARVYALGLSNENIERRIYATRGVGGLGARLTGTGRRGCMIALSHQKKTKLVIDTIKSAGGSALLASITNNCVKIEH